ncbi:DNA-binding protein [Halogeometricum borinquense]|uniref:DNA-binding protein n=1 Tax=Halogeometricum borinquense TaxID=60847 RepID=A0A6C0UEX7_9EURY|nr:DNA-binding protein [Halogeometricum borinquense]QIB73747.1 DNA-binding protein [Halogeometricum borinquense]QIQ76895.1 DNA-binding protein [Halogeometricum borinquense]
MWFQSGRRRDLCAILYDAGELRGQKLKTRLEAYYDTRIDPQSFYGTLDALVSKGYLVRRTEGIHDVYELTDPGVRGVESYYDWLTKRVESKEQERREDDSRAGTTDSR